MKIYRALVSTLAILSVTAAFSLVVFAATAAWTYVETPVEDGGPAIKEGFRSVLVPFPEHKLGGVNPGDRVDMIAVFEAGPPEGKEVVGATAVQNILVVGIRPGGEEGMMVLELAVLPQEAQYIALVMASEAVFTLAHRAPGDHGRLNLTLARLSDFYPTRPHVNLPVPPGSLVDSPRPFDSRAALIAH